MFGHVWSMYRSSPFRSTLNTGYITCLGMCEVCTEAVHSVALCPAKKAQTPKHSGQEDRNRARGVFQGRRTSRSAGMYVCIYIYMVAHLTKSLMQTFLWKQLFILKGRPWRGGLAYIYIFIHYIYIYIYLRTFDWHVSWIFRFNNMSAREISFKYMHQLITCINYTQNDCSFIVRNPPPKTASTQLRGTVRRSWNVSACSSRQSLLGLWPRDRHIETASRKPSSGKITFQIVRTLDQILNLKNWSNDQWKITMYLYIYVLCIRWIIQGFWRSLEDWDLFNICMTIVGKLPNKNSTKPQLSPQKPFHLG